MSDVAICFLSDFNFMQESTNMSTIVLDFKSPWGGNSGLR